MVSQGMAFSESSVVFHCFPECFEVFLSWFSNGLLSASQDNVQTDSSSRCKLVRVGYCYSWGDGDTLIHNNMICLSGWKLDGPPVRILDALSFQKVP